MKAKLKEKEVDSVPEGMKIIDLSVEKRIELYQELLKNFDAENSKVYGVSVGVEIKFAPQGIVPRMVLVDLLANKNEPKPTENKEEPKS
jgi:hypothetical protein